MEATMRKVLLILVTLVFCYSGLNAQNYSLSFDGVNDYTEVAISPTDYSSGGDFYFDGSLSMEIWFKTNQGVGTLLSSYSHTTHGDPHVGLYEIKIDVNGKLQSNIRDGNDTEWASWVVGAKTDTSLIDVAVNDGKWHHVAVVYDEDKSTIFAYLDGVYAIQRTEKSDPVGTPMVFGIINPTNPIQMGDHYQSNLGHSVFYPGFIDEVRIWNRALSETEISSKMYTITDPSNETGLIGYWKFNEGTGTTANDLSGNNHHGTINGAVWSTDVPPIPPSINVSIDSVITLIGDTISVPVRVEFPADSTFSSAEISFSGFQQSGLEYIGVVSDTGLMGTAGWTIQTNVTDTLLITASAGSNDISGSGEIFRLKFYVPFNQLSGFTPITLENALFNNGELYVLKNNGGIQANCPIHYGDVDQNGEIRAYDASQILKHLVGYITLDECQLRNADVTLDETVSSLDASVILMNVVGIIDTLPYDTTSGSLKASGIITMNNDGIQAGDTIYIPLNLSDGDNILSFESVIEYNPLHLTFMDILWSEQLNDFTIELNTQGGEIIIAGAGSHPDGREGQFGSIQFIVNKNFNESETYVDLKKLQWNEESPQIDVTTATLSKITNVPNEGDIIPNRFYLEQNYPNPFNPSTTISYQIPKSEYVEISVYDTRGRLIVNLENDFKKSGHYTITWDASGLGSGIYFYQIKAGNFVDIKKSILIK
jgi:hypothetical protein